MRERKSATLICIGRLLGELTHGNLTLVFTFLFTCIFSSLSSWTWIDARNPWPFAFLTPSCRKTRNSMHIIKAILIGSSWSQDNQSILKQLVVLNYHNISHDWSWCHTQKFTLFFILKYIFIFKFNSFLLIVFHVRVCMSLLIISQNDIEKINK